MVFLDIFITLDPGGKVSAMIRFEVYFVPCMIIVLPAEAEVWTWPKRVIAVVLTYTTIAMGEGQENKKTFAFLYIANTRFCV